MSKRFKVKSRQYRSSPWSASVFVISREKSTAAEAYADSMGVQGSVVRSDKDLFVIQRDKNDTFYIQVRSA